MPKRILFSAVLLTSLVTAFPAHGQDHISTTAQKACGESYQRTYPLLKISLGEGQDKIIAPRIDRFLREYARALQDTPSQEEHGARVRLNTKGPIDEAGAYNFMQRFSYNNHYGEFQSITKVLESVDRLAEASRDKTSLNYTQCLRDYMISTIQSLPDNGNFILKKTDLVEKLASSQRAPSTPPPSQQPVAQ